MRYQPHTYDPWAVCGLGMRRQGKGGKCSAQFADAAASLERSCRILYRDVPPEHLMASGEDYRWAQMAGGHLGECEFRASAAGMQCERGNARRASIAFDLACAHLNWVGWGVDDRLVRAKRALHVHSQRFLP